MGIYDAIKDGVKFARNAGNIELSLELAKVADDLIEKQKRISELGQKVNILEEKLKNKANVVFIEGVYYLKNDANKERPFCPRCLEKNGELITINTSFTPPDCPECKNNYDI
jgi:hypothetical protein